MVRPSTAAFLGMSLDGFIAGPHDELAWLERGGGPPEDHGFAAAGLLDEFTVSVLPVIIGTGIRLFEDAGPERWLSLDSSKVFASGMVQLRYAAGVGRDDVGDRSRAPPASSEPGPRE